MDQIFDKMINAFEAKIEIIGVNPFVFVPDKVLKNIFKAAKKDKTIQIISCICLCYQIFRCLRVHDSKRDRE